MDVNLHTIDLSIVNRDQKDDKPVKHAIELLKEHQVGVKCSTMTLTKSKVKEVDLKRIWKPASAQIRHALDSTSFLHPIKFKSIPQMARHWKAPVIIARHTHADVYDALDMRTTRAGALKLNFEPSDESMGFNEVVTHFNAGGVFSATYNTDESIKSFAHACFEFALKNKISVTLATKPSLLKYYDGRYRDIFDQVYEDEYIDEF